MYGSQTRQLLQSGEEEGWNENGKKLVLRMIELNIASNANTQIHLSQSHCRITTGLKSKKPDLIRKKKWRSIKKLLHPTADAPNQSTFTPGIFAEFFLKKVDKIRELINLARASFTGDALADDPAHGGDLWSSIEPVSPTEVMKLITSMPAKTSPLDYLPTNLLKSSADLFGQIIATLANKSFSEGSFPESFKSAQVKPLLKKTGLDPDNLSNYRPISNLNTISKIIERLFLSRLRIHIAATGNFNSKQSGFRTNHSTETALQSIFNDVYRAIDAKKLTLLVALDISAAFDALEHNILLRRLQYTFGISGPALNWIGSYLHGRSQFIKIDNSTSEKFPCMFGVPQGSVLGPFLFALHVSPVANVIEKAGLRHHQYADDTQMYISFVTHEKQQSIQVTERAVVAVRQWFILNGLQLNPGQDGIHVSGHFDHTISRQHLTVKLSTYLDQMLIYPII